MNVFFRLKSRCININKITEISAVRNDAVKVVFDDGTEDIFSSCSDADDTIGLFEKTIVQIVPCSTPLYNIYKNDDGSYTHEQVSCLALCVDGIVRSLAGGGYFDFAEEASNFVGCFDEDSLGSFPKTANGEAEK